MRFSLETGKVYYRCYECGMYDNYKNMFVSSWLYLGLKKLKCNTAECDRPYHFYWFVEYESFLLNKSDPKISINEVYIPSLCQVERTMLDLAQLKNDVIHWEAKD